ncbi:MAG: sigma-54-dependent Fis family transcriptional regulator [Bacteroidetes bacterium]|nr:sigma-54-dependent Fis family transcriptional regulator [Bacteroidota bacterium]MBK7389279.1 sigma-54-dependent Fis family transcriptional regulator [Bacteroidota bacterium]MBK8416183.1 sigma-54-dependent Fis family transcriptional regulator [Bacteroidota bacterium]MBK8875359.1 sigma-54-dependent Fis family transcriptional regulator [Bacteroidota bacterium]
MNIQDIKQRFGIIGHSPLLDHAIDTARQVAPTDITVLITGESGTGKEVFPQIIHQLSARKHGPYIAVNCGAIPEGTIDSELFGHEKGAFTGAHEARKGYFEVVNGGTIFLDEVAELPLLTQVRLLRVLESGEFLKVGSSKTLKTDVRVVAATNVNLQEAIHNNKFREDLYYRLNTVPIQVPALRQRKEDIHLLFRKFANDFAERYKMPTVVLQPDAMQLLSDYRWPGNVRQLKNVTEQLSILERQKNINAEILMKYIPQDTGSRLPVLVKDENKGGDFSERELLYKVLFEMKKDIVDLKKLVVELISEGNIPGSIHENNSQIIDKLYQEFSPGISVSQPPAISIQQVSDSPHEELAEELLSLEEKEKEIIKRAIEKHRGKRKYAAKELGISERTLYRKIKEYDIK